VASRARLQVIVDPETAKYSNGEEEVPRSEMSSRPLDLVVVLGGDGTLLSAVSSHGRDRRSAARREPGFARLSHRRSAFRLFSMLDQIAQGRAAVEQRSLMQCDLLRGEEIWEATRLSTTSS
jgi:NAD kinase